MGEPKSWIATAGLYAPPRIGGNWFGAPNDRVAAKVFAFLKTIRGVSAVPPNSADFTPADVRMRDGQSESRAAQETSPHAPGQPRGEHVQAEGELQASKAAAAGTVAGSRSLGDMEQVFANGVW